MRENPNTYDVSETETECEARRDSVHEIHHMGLSSLVLVLQVTVVEALLEAPLGLSHLRVFLVHHQHAVEEEAQWEGVLTLNH